VIKRTSFLKEVPTVVACFKYGYKKSLSTSQEAFFVDILERRLKYN